MPRIRMDMDEIADFQDVSPGKHRAKLVECVKDVSSEGNDMFVWEWEVIEGEDKGNTIRSYTSLLDNALGNLKTHMKAFGYDGKIDVKTEKLHGKIAIIVVSNRKYRDRDTGEEKERASVSNVLPDKKMKKDDGSKSAKKSSRIIDDDDDDDDDDMPF